MRVVVCKCPFFAGSYGVGLKLHFFIVHVFLVLVMQECQVVDRSPGFSLFGS